MLKRSSKDINEIAFSVVQRATGQQKEPPIAITPKKNPAAVALGRLGGLKGGKARAKNLSEQRRKEIASLAARKRWSRPPTL
jgi:hypothetical protein